MTERARNRPAAKPAVAALDRPFIREELADRVGYVRLDKNENLEPLPGPVLEELRRSLTQEAISPYPDLSGLYAKVTAMAGVAEEMILLGAGSDAVLKAIYDTFVVPGDEIVLHAPSYFMYEIYAVQAGAKAVGVPIGEDWALKLDVGPYTRPGDRHSVAGARHVRAQLSHGLWQRRRPLHRRLHAQFELGGSGRAAYSRKPRGRCHLIDPT